MKFNVKLLVFTALIFVSTHIIYSQTDLLPVNAETVVKKAAAQTVVYEEEFKNLLATETKTFQQFDKNGVVKKQSVIESNFIVYQSLRDKNVISEFRNIVKVDGKSVSNKDRTPDEFFLQIQKTNSVEKELERVQKESSRYDKNLEIQGLTLLQAPILSENLRPYFDFQIIGSENIQGNETIIISYQQKRKSPFISINEKDTKSNELSLNFKLDVPGFVKKAGVFLRGKLWVDAKTYQLWKEERELTAQTKIPLVILKTDFEYQPSDFGILVPKQIGLSEYLIKSGSKKDEPTTIKAGDIKFIYSKFSKADVEVKILDDTP